LTTRITELNAILDKRRELLVLKFGSLETTLSKLQQQQTAVTSFVSIYTSSTSSSSKK
jgi:flagellar capping protein FliD